MDSLKSEVELGYALPLLAKHAMTIPQAELAPHGLTSQHSINDRGEILSKDRITHDLSFPGKASFTSINNRIEDDSLVPCLFGKTMMRCIHYIIGCRQRHPKTIIWLAIQDYKSAYRRAHLNPEVSVKSMTPFPHPKLDMVIMFLRMTFGGKPNASEWGCISETVADLANKLLVCDSWDPSTLH